MNREEQKQIALKAMKDLHIDPEYIKAFKRKDVVTQFIRFAGYFIDEKTEHNLLRQIKKIEEETGVCVYAVTHENFEFGECFTMLCVSKYKEDIPHMLEEDGEGGYYAFAWVYNADCEWCSEFGTVPIKSTFGGIKRPY